MKILVVLNEVVIESNYTTEELQKVKKFAPEALQIMKGDKVDFEIMCVTVKGGANKYCVAFDTETNAGKAAVKLAIADQVANKKEWVAENYGCVAAKLQLVEEQVAEILDEVHARSQELLDTIEVVS